MNAATMRLVAFTEREDGPVCGLDEKMIYGAGGTVKYGRAGNVSPDRKFGAGDARIPEGTSAFKGAGAIRDRG